MDRRRRREQLSRAGQPHLLLGLLLVGMACRGFAEPPAAAADEAPSAWTDPAQCVPAAGVGLQLVRVASGFKRPLELAAAEGDSRLFVAEQGGRILALKAGKVLPVPFVDLSDRLTSSSNEQGLLGLVFHPRFPADPRFFVNYSERGSGATVIAELRVDPSNPDRALPGERRLLRVEQPYANHNAGGLAFGPRDGLLYVGLGDGGAGGDPQRNGQNRATLLGSMLRLDVDSGSAAPAPEPWAIGLRNPWRFSFDPNNSDLYIGDVGQNEVEEINWVSGSTTGGENYGWNIREGDACYGRKTDCPLEGRTDPVYTAAARRPCNSITGGHVYRGRCLPDLVGRYIFGDYCHSSVLSFEVKEGTATAFEDLSRQLDPKGSLLDGVASFGVDGFGELYVVSHRNGIVYRIAARASQRE
ncbi:MAG TPA: glucose dehydrogenase [Gemmatimonadetes bacterium]|nr:glucose dehydrogenase [Gemmatimonadota bacterium]